MMVRQLATVEPAYRDHPSYQSIERGSVCAELARAWDAPAVRGDNHLLMQSASGAEVYLGFIEDRDAKDIPPPLTTHGWAATELLTTDPDELAVKWREPLRKLAAKPYAGRRIGITVGPAGEWIEIVEAPPQ